MTRPQTAKLFPRMCAVVAAAVKGLESGRFCETTLRSLCEVLGASSASTILGISEPFEVTIADRIAITGRTSSGDRAREAAVHVISRRREVASTTPGEIQSFAVPLWSTIAGASVERRLLGALYVEFADGDPPLEAMGDLVESTATLLGGLIAQQARATEAEEKLRAVRAQDPRDGYLSLDEILEFDSMRSIRDEVFAAMRGDSSIMILGESGTGKTQIATAIARATTEGPVVRATLGFSDDLNTITSELFGHERGAFSGATSKRKGLVEYADGGTLILDEVLNLPPRAQQLLLDFTQFGTYRPLGYQGGEPKRASLRLVAVTNGNIGRAIADTRFRQDLYYRLATVPLTLPPLRQRRAEIPELAVRYLRRKDPSREWSLGVASTELLLQPDLEWPGNIRELEAVVARAKNRMLAEDDKQRIIRPRHLDLPKASAADTFGSNNGAPTPSTGAHVRDQWTELAERRGDLDSREREIIEEALSACGGVVAEAARALSTSRTGLISRMATLDVNPASRNEKRK